MLRRVLHWYGKESNLPRVFFVVVSAKNRPGRVHSSIKCDWFEVRNLHTSSMLLHFRERTCRSPTFFGSSLRWQLRLLPGAFERRAVFAKTYILAVVSINHFQVR